MCLLELGTLLYSEGTLQIWGKARDRKVQKFSRYLR